MLSVALPAPPGVDAVPVWTGTSFLLGATSRRVLAFGSDESGWSDQLYELHEDLVGDDHLLR